MRAAWAEPRSLVLAEEELALPGWPAALDGLRVALVSDVHAGAGHMTPPRLAGIVDHVLGAEADVHLLLGDYLDSTGLGDGRARALQVAEELARLPGAVAVLGNHDEAVVQGSRPTMTADARQVVEWTRSQLAPDQIDFLRARPLTAVDWDILYVHANARAPAGWAYIEGRSEAVRSLQASDRRYTFCGHVHDQALYHLSSAGKAGDFAPTPGMPIPLSSHRRWLAIPGSAGQPRDGNPAACYAIFEPDVATLTFHRVAYDHDTAAAKVRAAGLPEALAQRLIHAG